MHISSLPLRDRIAQLVFIRLGSNMHPTITADNDASRVEALMDRLPLGGLVVFNGDRFRTPQTLARLQSRSRIPLLIGTDMERGLGQQMRGATVFPHAMAFSKMQNGRLERAMQIAAREALAAGVHIGFLPVADVASNPANPIISTRAYGTEVRNVESAVRTCVRTCSREGLLTTAKHFPGHGNTDTDSHETLPIVTRSRGELQQTELPPFRAAVQEGVPLVMTAHVAYEALDPSGSAATTSKPIMTDLLRRDLRFRGAVITDSLLMAGAGTGETDPGEWAAALIRAGIDILLDVAEPERMVDNLVHLVQTGKLDESLVDASFQRVQALRARLAARFGPGVFQDPALAHPLSLIGCDAHRQDADDMATEAVDIIAGSPSYLASRNDLPGRKPLLALLVRPHTTYNDPTSGAFAEAVQRTFSDAHIIEIGPDTPTDELDRLLDDANEYERILAAVVVKPAAWHRFGLLPFQKEFVAALTNRYRVTVASLGSPVALDDFPDAALGLCTFSDVEPSMRALTRYMATLASSPGIEVS